MFCYNILVSDNNIKPIIFVKKEDAKKASLWNKLTNGRIIKQHGGFDIPEGDLHAIEKYQSPVEGKEANPQESQEVLSDLEKEIQQLKEKDKHTPIPPHTIPHENEQYFDETPLAHHDQDDDLY